MINERTFQPSNAHRLDDPQRLLWMPPNEAIGRLDFKPGMVVADIGAGTGFFALPFARAVGPAGMVWAVDLQPAMLKILEEKLRQDGAPGNIKLREGRAADTGLPDGSCDLAFLGNLWHELDEPGTVLAEMRRILRPGGRVAILDWRTDVAYPPGPPPEHRVAVSKTEATLKTDNWRNVWFHLLGQYSYLLVAAAE
jgi:ubiquinone/menaquinone biosynthesis C-methylase UbiE